MRFQPRIGHLLAAANENVVSLFDVETDKQIHSFQSHSELVVIFHGMKLEIIWHP